MTSSIAVGDRNFFYLYDANDERVAITEYKGGYYRTTYTLRGFGNQLLHSYVDNYWYNNHTFGPKEDEIRRGDRLLASNNGSIRHYVLDHLGSPRFLVDSNGGALGVGTQTFSPWGVGGTTNGGMLQFTGHERDAVNVGDASDGALPADLPDDFHARLYDPYEGHFLAFDPALNTSKALRDPQAWNRYVYALNSPINRTDPDGRSDVWFRLVRAVTTEEGQILGFIPIGERLSKAAAIEARQGGKSVQVMAKTERTALRVGREVEDKAFPNSATKFDGKDAHLTGGNQPHFQSEGQRGHTFVRTVASIAFGMLIPLKLDLALTVAEIGANVADEKGNQKIDSLRKDSPIGGEKRGEAAADEIIEKNQ